MVISDPTEAIELVMLHIDKGDASIAEAVFNEYFTRVDDDRVGSSDASEPLLQNLTENAAKKGLTCNRG